MSIPMFSNGLINKDIEEEGQDEAEEGGWWLKKLI